ncbi:DinB family protein [Streptomyces sp. NBC_00554]|uniref:DinB family protein n=1 Tax=Streptomyces sp. NBC_00554 TaxID=2903661 RepID=UPI00352D1A59|nr:DinB family protein [Streptomyces sp. NBC_00554]
MIGSDPKDDLRIHLQDARDTLLWKLEGLSEYDIRRPMTPTGTNLLGLVKHMTGAEAVYLGDTYDRPFGGPTPPWVPGSDAEPDSDLWATADETREEIVGRYRRVWAHSDATIDALALDALGRLPGDMRKEMRKTVTLHRTLVHVITETDRHAGHADIIRELIDGVVGHRPGNDDMASDDAASREERRLRLERAAQEADAVRLGGVRQPRAAAD